MESEKLANIINRFEGLTKKPEKYISLQEDQAELIKLLIKDLYNFTKETEKFEYKSSEVLEELIITDLDEEQIWQQVELQNNLIYNSLVKDIAHFLAKKDGLKFPLKAKPKKSLDLIGSDAVNTPFVESITEIKKINDQPKTKRKIKSQGQKSSIVDDKFFKLHEMEVFLEKIEKGRESNEEDEIDYFEEYLSSSGDDDDDDSKKQLHYSDFFDHPNDEEEATDESQTKKIKFSFEERNENNKEGEDDESYADELEKDSYDGDEKEGYNFKELENNVEDDDYNYDDNDDDNGDDDDDDDDGDGDGDDDDGGGGGNDDDDNDNNDNHKNYYIEEENENKTNTSTHPSTFEARQERLKLRIQNLEEEALQEKPWQLKGEVTANSRPQNSLLEEFVEFDAAVRPAPVLTEKSTLKLEDVIIQRIKDKAWDDVIRKFKPVETGIEYKKKLVLDQEKSKLSLAQIYEQEYLQQLDSKNETGMEKPDIEPPEYQEIRNMMNKLFYKLDALSNFHFTPKQVQPEVKIISNLPAISMEEVAPIATSDATLLAPEEVKPKAKGDLLGKSERTITDKKRERRQKKLKQKLKYKQMEAKAKKLEKPDLGNQEKKRISQKLLQKITKNSNITQLEENKNDKYIKSSSAFFSKLQTDTVNKIKKKNIDLKKVNIGKVKAKSKAR